MKPGTSGPFPQDHAYRGLGREKKKTVTDCLSRTDSTIEIRRSANQLVLKEGMDGNFGNFVKFPFWWKEWQGVSALQSVYFPRNFKKSMASTNVDGRIFLFL